MRFEHWVGMTDEAFVAMIQSAVLGGYNTREMADRLHVSVPVITRWASGRNLPRQEMRKAIYSALAKARVTDVEGRHIATAGYSTDIDQH
jgi:transcriptional regulator with XRE-family HTH domain